LNRKFHYGRLPYCPQEMNSKKRDPLQTNGLDKDKQISIHDFEQSHDTIIAKSHKDHVTFGLWKIWIENHKQKERL